MGGGPAARPIVRNTTSCWPICQRFEVAKYRPTPEGSPHEMKANTTGKTLLMIAICGLAWVWFRIVWRCWMNPVTTTMATRMR